MTTNNKLMSPALALALVGALLVPSITVSVGVYTDVQILKSQVENVEVMKELVADFKTQLALNTQAIQNVEEALKEAKRK